MYQNASSDCVAQDALSEAENFRSAAQEREADLVAQLATAKLDQDKLTQVPPLVLAAGSIRLPNIVFLGCRSSLLLK